VDLSTNQIADLSNITTDPALQWLNLAENRLTTIGALTLATGLYQVDLSHNFLDTNPNSQASAVVQQLRNSGVYVTWLPQQTLAKPSLSDPLLSGASQFQFTINSPAAQVYQVQTSADLIHWTPWATVTNTTGALQVADPSLAASAKFYRLLEQ
jgi:hypothetical protein